jgi:hypothetical protein
MMPLLVSPTAKQGIHHQTIGSMMQVSWNRSSRRRADDRTFIAAQIQYALDLLALSVEER